MKENIIDRNQITPVNRNKVSTGTGTQIQTTDTEF